MPYGLDAPGDQRQAGGQTDLLDMLADAIAKTMSQPEPQAPMAPPQQGMGGLQAAAAAMNPQTIPYFSQMANQPGQARFAQQQQSYEQALTGKRDALTAGVGLAGRQMMASRPGAGQRLQLKYLDTVDQRGTPIRVPYIFNPITGETREVDPDEVDALLASGGVERFVPPVIMPGMEVGQDGQPRAVITRIPRVGGRTTTVEGPNGNRLEPMPPTALATEAGGKAGVLGRFPDLMNVFNEADAAVGGSQGKLNQTWNYIQNRAARTGAGPILAPPELVNYYNRVKSILFPIVKATSGAVFPEAELARWEARFPTPGVHRPEEVGPAWDALIDEMTADIKAKYGAAGRTPPAIPNPTNQSSPSGAFSGKTMTRQQFDMLKPSEQQRWTSGGGMVK